MSMSRSDRGTRRLVYLIAGCVVGIGLWLGYTYLAKPASRVQSQHIQDNGYFYRMRAGFEVKKTGERLDFDYVVACNIRLTRWRDGGLSDDSSYSPRVMVKAASDGTAVMLKTLRACHRLTSENGDIPPDLLPLAIWFDNVEDLSLGIGYVSEDAYDNQLGKLRFHGARIDRATRSDWEMWRKQAADSFRQVGALPGPWGYDYPDNLNPNNPDLGRYVAYCHGYSRLKVADSMRAMLRDLWPAERPRFWALSNEEDAKIRSIIGDPNQPIPPGVGSWIGRFGSPSHSDTSGLPIRSGRTVGRAPHMPSRWPTETYPFVRPPVLSASPLAVLDAPRDTYAHKLELRDGALNGFATCQNRADLNGFSMLAIDPGWESKRHLFMIDEDVVRERNHRSLHLLPPTFPVERDEYVFIKFIINL